MDVTTIKALINGRIWFLKPILTQNVPNVSTTYYLGFYPSDMFGFLLVTWRLLQQTCLGLKGITFSMTSNIKNQQSQTILNHFSYTAVRMALIVVWGNHHGPVWNILKKPQIFIDICTKRQISRSFVISRFFCYAKLSYCMYIVVVSMWPCSKCCCLQVV